MDRNKLLLALQEWVFEIEDIIEGQGAMTDDEICDVLYELGKGIIGRTF
jgi:hypothetical protein